MQLGNDFRPFTYLTSEQVKDYKEAAERSDAKALNYKGHCLVHGLEGEKKDEKQAVVCFRKAAELGYSPAQSNLGVFLKYGYGVAKNVQEAATWFEKAALEGQVHAQFLFGRCFETGKGVDKDDKKALKWYGKAAEAGLTDAQFNLGALLYDGKRCTKDENSAFDWFIKAAEQGDPNAQYKIVELMVDPTETLRTPEREAVVLKLLLRLTEQGDKQAKKNLSFCLARKMGFPEEDQAAAIRVFLKLARSGDQLMQALLVESLEKGVGTATDKADAINLLLEQGATNPQAAELLERLFSISDQIFSKANEKKEEEKKPPAAAQAAPAQQPPQPAREESKRAQLIEENHRGKADALYLGLGCTKDKNEAIKWYIKAAARRYPQAQRALVFLLEDDEEIRTEENKALVERLFLQLGAGDKQAQKYLERVREISVPAPSSVLLAADLPAEKKAQQERAKKNREAAITGNAQDQFAWADCLANGIGVLQDLEKAYHWYSMAAMQDLKEAWRWFEKAAENGNAKAQKNLADCYAEGKGVEKNAAEAWKWYKKAAKGDDEKELKGETKGLATALYRVGECLREGIGIAKNEQAAVEAYKRSAQQGFAPAQYALAVCLQSGIGTAKDEEKAVIWHRAAAAQGLDNSQYDLAVLLRKGIGTDPERPNEFLELLESAANQDHPEAQYNFAFCLMEGGSKQDLAAAVSWYRKAAAQKHVVAMNNLGMCLLKGIGTEQDLDEAETWLTMAVTGGYHQAKENLNFLHSIKQMKEGNSSDQRREKEDTPSSDTLSYLKKARTILQDQLKEEVKKLTAAGTDKAGIKKKIDELITVHLGYMEFSTNDTKVYKRYKNDVEADVEKLLALPDTEAKTMETVSAEGGKEKFRNMVKKLGEERERFIEQLQKDAVDGDAKAQDFLAELRQAARQKHGKQEEIKDPFPASPKAAQPLTGSATVSQNPMSPPKNGGSINEKAMQELLEKVVAGDTRAQYELDQLLFSQTKEKEVVPPIASAQAVAAVSARVEAEVSALDPETWEDAEAQVEAAKSSMEEDNSVQAKKKAIRLYRIAAAKGNREIQYAFARLLDGLLEQGVVEIEIDEAEILGLYQSAAEKGHADAAYWLAVRLEDSFENDDKQTALAWYEKAAKQGHKLAAARAAEIRDRLEHQGSNLSSSAEAVFGEPFEDSSQIGTIASLQLPPLEAAPLPSVVPVPMPASFALPAAPRAAKTHEKDEKKSKVIIVDKRNIREEAEVLNGEEAEIFNNFTQELHALKRYRLR